jgi:hypothetical protein
VERLYVRQGSGRPPAKKTPIKDISEVGHRGESWLVLEYQNSTKWSVAQDEVLTRASQTIGMAKIMLTVIWGIDESDVQDEKHGEQRI